MRNRPTASLLALAMLLAPGVGCGPSDSDQPDTLPVSGKVTYKGKPVPKGTITFQSDQGRMATGEIQEDGTYSLTTARSGDGAVAGHHRVSIVANEGDPTLMPSSPGYVRPKNLVPMKYNQPDQSGLEANVTKDSKEFHFDLK